MLDYSAQIAAEYDRFAPRCPECGSRMRYLVRLGVRIIWECSKCGEQDQETLKEYHKRTGQ